MESFKVISGTIGFGPFEFDTSARELRKHGRKVKLQNQPFEILAMLLQAPGALVTREKLRVALWPNQPFVDFEHGLNRAINKVREALSDSPREPKYVETVARHGYRFVAPIAARSAVGHKLRLAVLPFENLSGDSEQEFFSDGITEEMIAQLGRLDPHQLGVIARTTAMQYKKTNKAIDQIGHELAVEYILEGSVRRVVDRVRITAQLIKVFDQAHLWAEIYDCELKDVLAIQSDVANSVRQSLAMELLPEEEHRRDRISFADSHAYEVYLKGRYFWSRRHEGGLKRAIDCFKDAIKYDPRLAPAYSGLADCCALSSWYGELPPKEAGPAARNAATKAVELDENLGEAHASLALVRFWFEWDWPRAEKEFQCALQLNPNYAVAHQWFASYLVAMGRFAQASAELKRAQELDPLSLIIVQSLGDPFFYARHYDEAIEQYQRTLEMNPKFAPAHFSLGRAYERKGMYKEAVAEFQQANAISGKMEAAPTLAHALALMGARTEALKILQAMTHRSENSYVPPLPIALIHLGLGQDDQAFDWLEKAFQERSCWLAYLNVDPVFDRIRSKPSFQRLLSKLGLAQTGSAAA